MNLDEILDSKSVNEILQLAQDNKINAEELITNDKFKEKVYNEFEKNGISYDVMRPLISLVGEEKCIDNLDIDRISSSASSTMERYFTTLLENGNSTLIDKVINEKEYRDYFFKNLDKNYSIVGQCDSKKIMELVDKVNSLDEDIPNISNLTIGLDDEDKKKILDGDYKKELFLSTINESNDDIVQDYINNNPKALYMYKEIGITKLAERGISFPSDIVKQKDFFEQLKDSDIVRFRKNINTINRNNYNPVLNNRVNKYEEEILNNFNPDKEIFNDYDLDNIDRLEELLKEEDSFIMDYSARREISSYLRLKKGYDSKANYYNEGLKTKLNLNFDVEQLIDMDIDNITDDEKTKEILNRVKEDIIKEKEVFLDEKNNAESNLKEISSSKFGEIFVDYKFQDTKKNVKINTREMLRYNKQLPEEDKGLDKEKEKMYSNIANIDALSTKEKYEIYQSMKDKDMTAELYKDFSKLKNKSYEEINKALYKINENSELSEKDAMENEAEIYKLNGEPFYMLVRALNSSIHENTNNPHSCYSLISGTNTKTFDEGMAKFLYGYGELDPKMVENVFESDSYTFSSDKNITTRPNRIMTPEEITESSSSYSEINIKNEEVITEDGKKKYKEMKPSYLVTMEEPTKEQIEESKRLGIPIIHVERERYQNKKIDDVEYEEYDHDIN